MINIINKFPAQTDFSFIIKIPDIFAYDSGIIKFLSSGNNNENLYNIYIKNNGIFDHNDNFIYSLNENKINFFSGNFYNNGRFENYYYSYGDFANKKILNEINAVSEIYTSGIEFNGFLKSGGSEYDIKAPTINIIQKNSYKYDLKIETGTYVGNNINVIFSGDQTNLGAIKISNITYDDFNFGYYYIDPEINLPAYVYPGQTFSFDLIPRYNLNQMRNIYLDFDTDIGPIKYEKAIFGKSNVLTGLQPELDISTSIALDNSMASWNFSIENLLSSRTFSITGDISFELSGDNYGQDESDTLYKSSTSNAFVFGYYPVPYVRNTFSNFWTGIVICNVDIPLTGKRGFILNEDLGNIAVLNNFSWTDKWDDALILNDKNSAGFLFGTSGDFNINNVNVYLYSKNNTSGLLNYYLYNVFNTGGLNAYRNILSGLGWTTGVSGTLSNCCGTSGFPPEFPSGFPFSGQDNYGFFSGFGYGKNYGYILTGMPISSGNINIESYKLTADDANYFAPIYYKHLVKIETNLNINSGLYAIIFNAVPNTGVENETGLFWPKMWPNRVIPPNQIAFAYTPNDNGDGNYFYQSGYENSGYGFVANTGNIYFINSMKSDNSGLFYSGIEYNFAMSINLEKTANNVIKNNFYNNFNVIKFNIYRYLNNQELLNNDFYDSCIYKISGNNIYKTGIIYVNKNNNRNLEANYI